MLVSLHLDVFPRLTQLHRDNNYDPVAPDDNAFNNYQTNMFSHT